MERRVDAAVVVLSAGRGTTIGTRTSLPTTFSAILVPRMANRKWCGAVDVIRSTRMVLDGGGSRGGEAGEGNPGGRGKAPGWNHAGSFPTDSTPAELRQGPSWQLPRGRMVEGMPVLTGGRDPSEKD